jgi:hypothetical protein
MCKRIIVMLFLVTAAAGNIFAEETQRASNRIALSLGLIGAEVSYEKVLSPYFSILGQVSYNNWVITDSISVAGKGRIYPFGGAFYLDLGLGFSNGYNATDLIGEFVADLILGIFTFGLWFTTEEYQNRVYSDVERENGFLIQPGLGWNIDIGKKDHFMMPIGMGLDIRISNNPAILYYFRIGLGYAF